MYGSPHKKSGLPGLMGTHDKSSPLPIAGILAGLGKAALAVGKFAVKTVPQAIKTGVQAVGGAVKTGAQAVGDAGKFVGKNVGEGAKNFIEATKKGSQARLNLSNTFKSVKGDVSNFAKTSKGKAVIGGLYAGKKAADKQVAEVNQSIYNQKNRGGVGDFSKMNFGNRV